MALKTSSFTPKTRVKTPNIPGTLPSLHNNLLLVSTGVPSVDKFIGCLPIGTILLIEEDQYQCYSKVLAKYYLAEGVTCGHDIVMAGAESDLNSFVKELPSPVDSKKTDIKAPSEELKIAWRYQSIDSANQGHLSKLEFNRNFDLTKRLPAEVIQQANIKTIDLSSNSLSDNDLCEGKENKFDVLFANIRRHIEEGGFSNSKECLPSTVLRILIQSAGSPLWSSRSSEHLENAFLKFLYLLRAMLRSAVATCMITVPSFLWEDDNFVKRLRHLCDTVVRLESFAASNKETNPLYKDFHGLFYVEKLPRLNSLLTHAEHPEDLAFKLGKKKFLVEKLCLPPMLDEENQGLSFCSSKTSGLKRHLEF